MCIYIYIYIYIYIILSFCINLRNIFYKIYLLLPNRLLLFRKKSSLEKQRRIILLLFLHTRIIDHIGNETFNSVAQRNMETFYFGIYSIRFSLFLNVIHMYIFKILYVILYYM